MKKLTTETIPHVGISLWIESDQGTHFTAETNHLLAKTLGYSLKFHTPYHYESLGQMEHRNLDTERTLGKICQETGLEWPEALPLALIKIWNIPNRRYGLTPFEIECGHPMVYLNLPLPE